MHFAQPVGGDRGARRVAARLVPLARLLELLRGTHGVVAKQRDLATGPPIIDTFWGLQASVRKAAFNIPLADGLHWERITLRHVRVPFWNLIAFGRYPLSIYSGYIQFLLSWIIPFGFATFYPSARLLGHAEFRAYAPLVPLIAVATFAVAATSWRLGLRRYSSTGS